MGIREMYVHVTRKNAYSHLDRVGELMLFVSSWRWRFGTVFVVNMFTPNRVSMEVSN